MWHALCEVLCLHHPIDFFFFKKNVYLNYLEGLLKHRGLVLTSRVSHSVTVAADITIIFLPGIHALV